MPTPFYHLQVAADLLQRTDLSAAGRDLLSEQQAAFWLGNTAPDVQAISHQDRRVTHFFDLPILPGMPTAWERMLDSHPDLSRPWELPPAQAAFVAGYLCHLQADWLWVQEIFVPVFGPWATWGSFRQRLYLHNVLRAYLDAQILPALPAAMGAGLGAAAPASWLPYVQDGYLAEWRDWLAGQLQPGAASQTVEVFAQRAGLAPEDFYRLLQSEEQMEAQVFSRLPPHSLADYRRRLLDENIRLLAAYFSHNGHSLSH